MYNRFFHGAASFRRLFSFLSLLLWTAVLIGALYIAAHVTFFYACPSAALSRGLLLSHVAPMMEHVLMSVLLLTACGLLEERIFHSD